LLFFPPWMTSQPHFQINSLNIIILIEFFMEQTLMVFHAQTLAETDSSTRTKKKTNKWSRKERSNCTPSTHIPLQCGGSLEACMWVLGGLYYLPPNPPNPIICAMSGSAPSSSFCFFFSFFFSFFARFSSSSRCWASFTRSSKSAKERREFVSRELVQKEG